jgi:hypothetical protein
MLFDSWQQHNLDKAEAWYSQAQIQYKGIYTKVKRIDSQEKVEFNAPAYRPMIDPKSGSVMRKKVYLNSIETLPRAKVIVTLQKSSPTQEIYNRQKFNEITNVLAGHGEMFTSEIRVVTMEWLKTLDLEPEMKQYLETLFAIHRQNDLLAALAQRENNKTAIVNGKVGQAQGMQMLQQMEQQLAQTMQPQPVQRPEAITPATPQIERGSVQEATFEETTPASGPTNIEPVQTPRGPFVP